MPLNINSIHLSGVVLQDPYTRQTRNGKLITTFPLQHTYSFKKADGGTINQSFTRSVAGYGATADQISTTVRAGQTVLVTGSLRIVEDKRGDKVDTIVATSVQLVYTAHDAGALH